ncbi:MAG: CoA transferase [Acidimicrobiia bacterium]|nr:CoA transferase [Acidimicrobiia bacterium]
MNKADSSSKPLVGLVVADFTRILAGPMCTMVLADLGADVIKIERPVIGDDTRTWGPPFVDDDAAYFLSINRNKRSIELDLTADDDAKVARDIIERSDVLVENFRPGVMDKFGFAYTDVSVLNPGLVYCSMPAYLSGDQRNLPGYDLLMQAASGFMSITGETGREPVKMGVALLDVISGLYGAVAILSALRDRDKGGQGRLVEVGLFEASVASLVNQAANYLMGSEVPVATGNSHPNIVPYQGFSASNGRFVLAAANDKLFRAAATAMNRSELADDARFASNGKRVAHRAELIEEMEEIFMSQPVDYWVDAFVRAGVPAAPVRTIDQVFASPEGLSTLMNVADSNHGPLRLVRSPIRYGEQVDGEAKPPPTLGRHQAEVLEWITKSEPLRTGQRGG